jgi:hypothetical protein
LDEAEEKNPGLSGIRDAGPLSFFPLNPLRTLAAKSLSGFFSSEIQRKASSG